MLLLNLIDAQTENTINNCEPNNKISFYVLLFGIKEESYWSVISIEEASVRDS